MLLKPGAALALSACGTVTASLAAHKSVNVKRNTTSEQHWDTVKLIYGIWGVLRDSSNKLKLF